MGARNETRAVLRRLRAARPSCDVLHLPRVCRVIDQKYTRIQFTPL